MLSVRFAESFLNKYLTFAISYKNDRWMTFHCAVAFAVMMWLVKVLALLPCVWRCADSWAYTHSVAATRCKRACTYTTYFNFNTVCRECSEDPPIEYTMCEFACANTNVNKHNYEYLNCICRKCFEKGDFMPDMCTVGCGVDPKVQYYRLCKDCEMYGYYLMDF